ncbi:MAG: dihydroxyacetone kinase subunit DhaK [Promicromonosporaceae bacterium]|nr:dihydroxyacetone kinase subunit DhaK [Promicromonosporaceae bacterium]
MKKLLDNVDDAVTDSLAGFAQAHADLVEVNWRPLYVRRRGGTPPGQVAVVSGGGSGHEPLHAGFVGEGMLAAAIPGEMFTSPSAPQIAAAYRSAEAGAGVLAIVKNYTGDILNFGLAAELVELDDIAVEQVVVDDDVAVEDSTFTAGRRGVAGTLLVEKIAGAAAARGDSLAEVTACARHVLDNVASMGVALAAGTVPAVGRPGFDLGPDEIEIGVGIHGEPGRRREPHAPATEITRALLEPICADLALEPGERVLLLVNGMGGTPLLEQYLVYGRARAMLEGRGVTVERSLVGNYVTSLDMHGVSLTVLRLDDALIDLWDAPTHTPALR